jgi:CO dehydrogenase/acetyl-CoA synthase delta subunit
MSINEENIELKYSINLRDSAITHDEVISFVKHTIEEVKKKYPEMSEEFDKIEVIKIEDLVECKFHPEIITVVGMIISVTLSRIIFNTWIKVVIPFIQKKLKIEKYRDDKKDK